MAVFCSETQKNKNTILSEQFKNTTLLEQFKNPKENHRDKIDTPKTPNAQIHDQSLSWLGTGTSIISGWVELVLWAQTLRITKYYKIYFRGQILLIW